MIKFDISKTVHHDISYFFFYDPYSIRVESQAQLEALYFTFASFVIGTWLQRKVISRDSCLLQMLRDRILHSVSLFLPDVCYLDKLYVGNNETSKFNVENIFDIDSSRWIG